MTSNAFSWSATRVRRATFVPTPTDDAPRRLHIGVTIAAVVVSAASIGIVAPLVF